MSKFLFVRKIRSRDSEAVWRYWGFMPDSMVAKLVADTERDIMNTRDTYPRLIDFRVIELPD